MIVGSGFIAKNFSHYKEELEKLGICLYAAGISNSQINDHNLLEKEKTKIIDFSKNFDKEKKIVYFSTCSILDPSRNKSLYVKNKLYIENLIKENFDKFLILRLPEVVGKNDNNITLMNFLYQQVINKKKFEIWKKAKRNLIDIDDAVLLTMDCLKKNIQNKTVNIANPIFCYATEIVKIFEKLSKIKANFNLVDKGNDKWIIDISEISEIIKNQRIKFDDNYLHKAIRKYYF